MSDHDPFRSLYPDQPNIQKLHTVAGDPVGQTGSPNSTGPNVERAVYSTAPYKGRDKRKCMANGDTCTGWRAKDTEYCTGHLRSFGMLKNDSKAARKPKAPG